MSKIELAHLVRLGRYYVGLGMSFKEYDLTHQNVEFSSCNYLPSFPLDVHERAAANTVQPIETCFDCDCHLLDYFSFQL